MADTQKNIINAEEIGYMSYNKLNIFITILLLGFSITFAVLGDRIKNGLNGLAGVGIYMAVVVGVVVVVTAKSILTSESLSINNPFHDSIHFFHTLYGKAIQGLQVNNILFAAFISIFSVIGILCLMFQWKFVFGIIGFLLVIFTIFNILLLLKPGMSNVSLPSMHVMPSVSLPSMHGIVTGLASLWERVGSHFKNPTKISPSEQIVLYMMGLLMLSTYLFLMLYATFNNAYGEIGTNSEEIEKLNSERRNSLYMWFSLLLIAIIPYILWLIPLLDFSNGMLMMYIRSLKICVIIVSVISFFISQ